MAAAQFETWVDVNLQAGVRRVAVPEGFFTQDHQANKLGVRVYNGAEPVNLYGGIRWHAKLADGTTVSDDGEIIEYSNMAYAVLKSEAYACVGPIAVAIQNIDDDNKTVLAVFTGYVHETVTDQRVIPGNPVPDIDTLLEEIGNLRDATTAANNIVLVQETQPENATGNKIWVQPQSDEYQVPTWEEFQALDTTADSLGESMTTAEGDIDALETRMTTAEGDIDSLETTASDHGARLNTAEDDIDAIEGSLSNLKRALFEHVPMDTDNWEQGTISAASGSDSNSDNVIRTKNRIPIDFYRIYALTGYEINVYGWSEGTYLGYYDGTGYKKTGTALDHYTTERLASDLIAAGADSIRIAMRKTGGGVAIDPSECVNTVLIYSRVSVLESEETNLKSALLDASGIKIDSFSDPTLRQYINTSTNTVSWNTPSVSAGTNYKWAVVPCTEGDIFTITGHGGSAPRLWAFCNKNNTVLSRADVDATADYLQITAPEGAAYLIINDDTDSPSFYGVPLRYKVDRNTISFAPNYDSSKTYNAGDYVTYNNLLYRCLCDIATPESWADNHWMNVDAGCEMRALQRNEITYLHPGTDGIVPGKYAAAVTAVAEGNRLVINGVAPASSTNIVIKAFNGWFKASANNDSVTTKRFQLIDGHSYQAELKYISGTATKNVHVRFADGNSSRTAGTYTTNLNKDNVAQCVYSKALYPDGISPNIFITRNSEDNTLTDYTVELTIRDVTVEAQIAPIENTIAMDNHAVGDVFWLDGILYKVTAAIAAGETITPGTNVSATTVMAELSALKALIANN